MQPEKTLSSPGVSASLSQHLTQIFEECTACGLCQKQCAFLKKHGTPKDIADSYDPDSDSGLAFECSLCNLCSAVCPFKVNPAGMFLEMRREAVRQEKGEFSEHRVIRNKGNVQPTLLSNKILRTSHKYRKNSMIR